MKMAINNSDQRAREGEWGAATAGRRGRPRALLSRGAAPARCCQLAAARARPLVYFFVVKPGTHTRAPTLMYSTLHIHLFKLNSAEKTRTRTPLPALRRYIVSVHSCTRPQQSRGPRPPARHLDPQGPSQHAQHTTPADVTLHRARGACPHAHSAQAQGHTALSHKQIVTRGRQTQTLS